MTTLRDPAAAAALDRDGYVVVAGHARPDLPELRAAFAATHPDLHPDDRPPVDAWTEDPAPGPGFVNDLEAPFEVRDEIERRLGPILARYADDLLVDHRTIVSTFLVKWPDPHSHLPLHQDPSFVDETRSRALTVWVAIDDAGGELANGPLHVLPGSHLVADEYRGTRTNSTFLAELGRLWPATVALPVTAGDVVVLDGRLVHGSPPNTGGRLRLAACAPVAPRSAPLVHAVGVDADEVVLLDVDDDFYRRTSPGRLWADPPAPPADAPRRVRAARPFSVEALLAAAASG